MKDRSNKSRRLTIFRTVLLVIISLVLGISVYSFNAKNLVGNNLPMPFGFGMSVVLSGSMEPELSVNDLVFVEKNENYNVDDIVVYQSGDILIIHRIVKIDGDTVTTKGDANSIADEPILQGNIKGKLIGKIPFIGLIVKAVKSPVGVITILAVSVLLLELSWKKKKQNDSKELDKIREEIEKLKSEKNFDESGEEGYESKTQ